MNDATPDPVAALEGRLAKVEADLAEAVADLAALARIAGDTLGQPFARQAAEIIAKRQTSALPSPEELAERRRQWRKAHS